MRGYGIVRMKISEIISGSARPFPSLEIVPPSGGMTLGALLDRVEPLMEFSPRYINVTRHREAYGSATRMGQKEVCLAVRDRFGVEVVPHILCAGATKEQIRGELDDFKDNGIENVLALRGDCLLGEKRFVPDPQGYSYASELVEGIREYRREEGRVYCIGVGGYPEKHFEAPNIETDVLNLKKKVDAGADYVITQMFFDNAKYYDFVSRCRQAGITVPIIPGIKPLSSSRQLSLLPQTFSIDIPYALSSEVERAGDDEERIYRLGVEWCVEQCRDLLRNGIPAIHFYTMGRMSNIAEILKACF